MALILPIWPGSPALVAATLAFELFNWLWRGFLDVFGAETGPNSTFLAISYAFLTAFEALTSPFCRAKLEIKGQQHCYLNGRPLLSFVSGDLGPKGSTTARGITCY